MDTTLVETTKRRRGLITPSKSTLWQSIVSLEKFANGDASEVIIKRVKLSSPPMYGSEDVKSIRRKVGTTQRVLARVLAVSPRTVESWEAGRSTPNGSSRRLLELLDRDPKIINKLLA